MKKKIIVVEIEGTSAIPEKASEFMAYWQEKLDVIPNEYMESAKIEIEATALWEYPSLDVEVSYEREETKEEAEERESQQKARESSVKQRELAELERLKQKYGA